MKPAPAMTEPLKEALPIELDAILPLTLEESLETVKEIPGPLQ